MEYTNQEELRNLQTNLNIWYQKDQQFKSRSKLSKGIILILVAIFIVFYQISDRVYESVYNYEIIVGFIIFIVIILPVWMFYLGIRQTRIKKYYNLYFYQFFNQIKKAHEIYTLYQEQFKITSVIYTGRNSIVLALLSLDLKAKNSI